MVRYLTMNGKADTHRQFHAFALRYRRVNAAFYDTVILHHSKFLVRHSIFIHSVDVGDLIDGKGFCGQISVEGEWCHEDRLPDHKGGAEGRCGCAHPRQSTGEPDVATVDEGLQPSRRRGL